MRGRRLLEAMTYIDEALIEEAAPFSETGRTSVVGAAKMRSNWKGFAACAAVLFTAAVSLWAWKDDRNAVYEEALPQEGANAGNIDAVYELAENAPIADNGADLTDDAGGAMFSGGIAAGLEDSAEENKEAAADDFGQHLKGNAIVRVIEEFPPKWGREDDSAEEYPATVQCYKAPEKGQFFLWRGLKSAISYWDDGHNTIELAEPEEYVYHVAIDVFGDVTENGDVVYEKLRVSEEGKEKLYQEYERMFAMELEVSLSEDFELTGMLSRDEIEGFEPCADYGYAFRLVNEY